MASFSKAVSDFLRKKYILLSETDSTNEFCKSEKVNGDAIVRALRQRNGRGRMGRKFFSDEGGFYISYCFFPKKLHASTLLPLTGLCAVGVLRAIERTASVCPDIKWTNDLLLEGKKICGILAESVLSEDYSAERVIIGIGINTNQQKECFCGELSGIASSIYALCGKKVDEELLLYNLTDEMLKIYSLLGESADKRKPYVDIYKARCLTLGKDIKILKPSIAGERDPRELFLEKPELFPTARAVDIDENFGLVVSYPDMKKETITSGEVSVR